MRHLIALVLVILAGCASPTVDIPVDEAPTPTAPPPTFLLGDVRQVAPNPNTQSEAAITVSPDGQTLLTCFHGFFTSLSPGHASTDGGATWHNVDLPLDGGVGGDCETALLEDGSWVFLASTVAGATVLVSQDEGATWTANPAAAIPVNGLADRPWLAGVGNEIWLAYMPLNSQPGTIGFTKSTDHGATWTTPIWVGTPGPESHSLRHGHFVVGDGTVQIPSVRYSDPASGLFATQVQVATTTDAGATWTTDIVYAGSAVVPDWPSMAITESGDRILIATGLDGDDRATLGFHQPPGGAWSEPFVVHGGHGGRPHWPFIDGGSGHNATFVISGSPHDGASHVWLGRIDARDLSVTEWPLAPGDVEFASVDHDANGNAYAVWTLASDAQYFVRGGWSSAPTPPI